MKGPGRGRDALHTLRAVKGRASLTPRIAPVAEIRTVTTLRTKRDEIAASIAAYERKLDQARADLSHITAAIKIFEASGDPADMGRYVDVHRLFGRNRSHRRKLPRGASARLGQWPLIACAGR